MSPYKPLCKVNRMKLCLDINDKYGKVLDKLNEKERERLIKGISVYVTAILASLENIDDDTLYSMLKMHTGSMFLLGQLVSNRTDDEDDDN